MFGKIKDVTWLNKLTLSNDKEENIKSCIDVQVNFCSPQNISEFDYLVENFQRHRKNEDSDKDDNNSSVIVENNKFDRLIVMDDVSELADNSDILANFLTVARKFNLIVVYVFHTMYPSKQN